MKKIKALGQHFLTDETVVERMVESLVLSKNEKNIVVEVGPGEGMLTKYLQPDRIENVELFVVELDKRLPAILLKKFPALKGRILHENILRVDFDKMFKNRLEGLDIKESDVERTADELVKFSIIGNFPYNISSQIVFKVLENRDQVIQMIGMFQREVAQRLAAKPKTKHYGILSVLVQAYYDVSYLLEIPPESFDPPPKVHSASVRFVRTAVYEEQVNYKALRQMVKRAFSQRRKKLKNVLKGWLFDENGLPENVFDKRAEELSVQEFIDLTNARLIE